MTQARTDTVPFRRKRKGLTNYKKRLKLLLSGKRRLVIRKSLNNILAQVVEYTPTGDKVVLSSHSSELNKFGWKASKGSIPGAYLTGLLLGKKAKEKGLNDFILDIGFNKSAKGGRVYAALKGVFDCGINVPHSEEILPSEDRIRGEHIKKYAALVKKDSEAYKKRFSLYIKNNVNPEDIGRLFDETKKKILGVK